MRVLSMAAALLGAVAMVSTAAAADLEVGKKVWAQKCAMCHGADGKGSAKMAEQLKTKIPDLGASAAKPDSELLKAIADGKKPMPAFGKSLKQNELDAVLHYAKGLAKELMAGKK